MTYIYRSLFELSKVLFILSHKIPDLLVSMTEMSFFNSVLKYTDKPPLRRPFLTPVRFCPKT